MRFPPFALLVVLVIGPRVSAFVSLRTVSQHGCQYSVARSHSQLASLPEPLASEGDWTAFLDEETTGLIYYFNSQTGESVWEAPTKSFPEIRLTSAKKVVMDEKRKEYQAEQGFEYDTEGSNAGSGVLGALFSRPKKESVVVVDDAEVKESLPETSGTSAKDDEAKKSGFFGGMFKSLEESKGPSSSTATSTTTEEAPSGETGKELVEPNGDAGSAKASPMFSFASAFGGAKPFKGSREVEEEIIIEEAMSVEDDDIPDEMVEEALKVEKSFVFPDVLSVFKSKAREPDIIVPSERVVAIETASRVLPSPEKISWGGEDACFIKGRTFGVFDGVSGADKLDGVPLYSDTLAKRMQKAVPENGLTIEEITTVLTEAAEFADVAATGASTAVVGSIGEDSVLRALNLGDCVVMVFRDGKVVARTKEITHYFDCPYQLGEDSPDRPIDGTILKTEVCPGDIIVAGSDGIFDNLVDEDIWGLIASSKEKASIIAKSIIDESRAVSLDEEAPTPYAKLAKKNRYEDYKSGLGGKVDDISCVVVRCS